MIQQVPIMLNDLDAQNPEKAEKTYVVMLNKPKVNLEKLAETTKMSNGSLFNNLHILLGMKKLLRFLIVDQKRI